MGADQESNRENAEGDSAVQNVLVPEPTGLTDGIYDRGAANRQAKKTPKFLI